jgi:hypothetical protein
MRTKIDKLAETLEVTKLQTDAIYDYLQECAQASEPLSRQGSTDTDPDQLDAIRGALVSAPQGDPPR